MTQSAFTAGIITQVANELGLPESLPENGWKRRWLGKKLRELEAEIPIYKRREAIRRPARVRDRFRDLEAACGKAPTARSESFEKRVQKIIRGCEFTRALLLWHAALVEDRARPEAAIGDGRAQQALERLLKDPHALCKAAVAARESVVPKVASGRGGARHKPDWALEQAIILLGVLFWELTGKTPRISVDAISARPTGHFLQLLKLCLPPLGWQDFSDEALRHKVRKLSGGPLGRSPVPRFEPQNFS